MVEPAGWGGPRRRMAVVEHAQTPAHLMRGLAWPAAAHGGPAMSVSCLRQRWPAAG
jgi:hypothetical protein